ncbi:MAG TPA: purine-binding chemotaxis protein CheW [Actinobacteria bacterium]|nr:purine-binding chemotaxis protein CheW [Actinomycetota bacterium]
MTVSETTKASQYLAFSLDDELFAVNVDKIREILDYTTVTRVPQTPDFMRGVINLRGGVVPVVDMRRKFDISECQDTVDTCIVVLEVSLDGKITLIGALVDSVQEVFDLEANQIEPPPKIGTNLNTDHILGMGKREEDFIIILDVDKVFSGEDISKVQSVSKLEEVPEAELAKT